MVRIFQDKRNEKTEGQREEEIEEIEQEIRGRGERTGRVQREEPQVIPTPRPQSRSPPPIQEEKVKLVEREITLSYLNDKLNYLINLIEGELDKQQ